MADDQTGDDRGRELTEALTDVIRALNDIPSDPSNVLLTNGSRRARQAVTRARRALRALAAPAETAVPTGSLLDAIGNAVYEAGVGRSGPDPTWHGVATAAERAARAWFARLAAPAETEADCSCRVGEPDLQCPEHGNLIAAPAETGWDGTGVAPDGSFGVRPHPEAARLCAEFDQRRAAPAETEAGDVACVKTDDGHLCFATARADLRYLIVEASALNDTATDERLAQVHDVIEHAMVTMRDLAIPRDETEAVAPSTLTGVPHVTALVRDMEALNERWPGHVRRLLGEELCDRLLAHLIPAAPPAPEGEAGEPLAEWERELLIHDEAVRFCRWLVTLDEPEGYAQRRTANLGDICARARRVLAGLSTPVPAGPQAEGAGETVWPPSRLAALERDRRRFLNDPDRCQDCELVEACDCRGQWSAPLGAGDEAASGGGS